ncbi:MAG: protein-L-isoaspartate(D-aspartate) O-methyltransferase [Rubricoccaceae bacterium]|nr:protein-L-isoaspartate(D-aspartate) O-methyltransferase [Rubricoccaceae bacterium]
MRFDADRAALVNSLRTKGISNERVLEAIGRVPRHLFVDRALQRRAYNDEALPIGLSQTISQPFTVAFQTSLLNPQPDERILEIGTGSGYQAAVLAEMGARVFSVERHAELLRRTNTILRKLNYRVRTHLGDGTKGWSAVGPFDGIIVTAGGVDIPEALLEQLREPIEGKPNARLIIPIGVEGAQTMHRITRTGTNSYENEQFGEFSFVPLVRDQ